MAYTLKPEDTSEHGHAAGYLTPRPISLRRISLGVSLGAVVLIGLAGIPSLGRRPLPAPDGRAHARRLACDEELRRLFADLCEPADAAGQRREYPSLEGLNARLQPVADWSTAVLFAHDATPDELHAAGLADRDLCAALHGPPRAAAPEHMPWKLVLLDARERLLGSLVLTVPGLQARRCLVPGRAPAGAPGLDRRLPDWPRAAVFTRPFAGAQSEG